MRAASLSHTQHGGGVINVQFLEIIEFLQNGMQQLRFVAVRPQIT